MTTFTIQGFSRVMNYDTSQYEDYSASTLQVIRPDFMPDFHYEYGFIDETGMSPQFAEIFYDLTHSSVLSRPDMAPVEMVDSAVFLEKLVYAVSWGVGKTTYVFQTFDPVGGVEHVFFIGGDMPTITDLASLNAFLANPRDYILDGPFEGGNDIPLADFLNTTVTENDLVTAHTGVDLYWDGGAGHDTLNGGSGDDTLLGGVGNDSLWGDTGANTLVGGAGDDTLTGTGNFDYMSGGAGNDVLLGGSTFGENLSGGAGDDLIEQTNGQDFGGGVWFSHGHANGGSGNDTINGGLAGDHAFGGNGNDVMSGIDGDDNYAGGAGDDTINGGVGNDNLQGGDGNDSLIGGTGDDLMNGGLGNDRMSGDTGNDTMTGDAGKDTFLAGAGNDSVNGGFGNDSLRGDSGRDTLVGGVGNDTLQGGANQDLLQGETGADQFRYIAVSESTATAMDTISGFELGVDDISLSTIDAKPLVAGDQAFAFIGTAAFTAVGQVRIVESGGSTRVEVNTVGTSGAEMVILIDGVTGLLATDFIL